MWVTVNALPVRDAFWLHEYGKDNYWNGEKMVWHTVQIAIPIFQYAFPDCQALFAFDNASNHCCFAPDALIASNINLHPGGKQPLMRDSFDHARGLPQSMRFPDTHHNYAVRGKAKGAEVILRERGLWPCSGHGSDGFKFLRQCSMQQGGCNPLLPGGCCAQQVLSAQQDFQNQKGQLEEEIEAANHLVIFYPKFHCELNFIERFWCAAKWYAREHCEYSLDGLRKVLPAALNSVSIASINCYYNHCVRVMEAYIDGLKYGTKAFTEHVYKGHRQVVDKSKW
jgi:hypothetical protein